LNLDLLMLKLAPCLLFSREYPKITNVYTILVQLCPGRTNKRNFYVKGQRSMLRTSTNSGKIQIRRLRDTNVKVFCQLKFKISKCGLLFTACAIAVLHQRLYNIKWIACSFFIYDSQIKRSHNKPHWADIFESYICNLYTVSQKRPTLWLSISSPNINRFSKFFHWCIL